MSESRKDEFTGHPNALGPSLTVSELFLFCDVCELMRDGLQPPAIAEQLTVRYGLRVTHKRCLRVLDKVAKAALNDPRATRGRLRLTTPGSEGDSFYQRISFLLATLKRPEKGPNSSDANRVTVHGSDFCVLWVLPAVLAESGILRADIDLEIKRGSFRKYMAYLRDGRTDLAVGPKAPAFNEFESTCILTVPRVLIYPEGHPFACGKAAAEVTLSDLKDETVFCLESEAVPDVQMGAYFPVPRRKRVVVDSVSHIYRYVARGLGVSLGYHTAFVPDTAHPGVSSVPLQGDDASRVKPAEFFLYHVKDRPLPGGVQKVREAICEWAQRKMDGIAQSVAAIS